MMIKITFLQSEKTARKALKKHLGVTPEFIVEQAVLAALDFEKRRKKRK